MLLLFFVYLKIPILFPIFGTIFWSHSTCLLSQCFLNLNVHLDHLGSLLRAGLYSPGLMWSRDSECLTRSPEMQTQLVLRPHFEYQGCGQQSHFFCLVPFSCIPGFIMCPELGLHARHLQHPEIHGTHLPPNRPTYHHYQQLTLLRKVRIKAYRPHPIMLSCRASAMRCSLSVLSHRTYRCMFSS